MRWEPFEIYGNEYDMWYQKNRAVLESEKRLIRAMDMKGLGLDVGVGTGIFVDASRVTVGIDPALGALRIARKRGVDVVRGVGEALPFRNGSFDFVVMVTSLCFVKSTHKVLMEVFRILMPKGEVVVCEVPKDSEWGALYEKKKEESHRFYKYARFYTFDEINKMLREAGFKIAVVKSTLSYPPNVEPRAQEPEEDFSGQGFVCIKAVKGEGGLEDLG
ncbi:MAG: class I SAM-dependent methyltransferase [Candidatus Methanomethylicaceae archaeon]